MKKSVMKTLLISSTCTAGRRGTCPSPLQMGKIGKPKFKSPISSEAAFLP